MQLAMGVGSALSSCIEADTSSGVCSPGSASVLGSLLATTYAFTGQTLITYILLLRADPSPPVRWASLAVLFTSLAFPLVTLGMVIPVITGQVIGYQLVAVLMNFSSVMSGLLFDRLGVGSVILPRPVGCVRVVGALLVLLGVVLSLNYSDMTGGGSPLQYVFYSLFTLVAGLSSSVDAAMGSVMVKCTGGSTVKAAFVKVSLVTSLLVVTSLVFVAIRGIPVDSSLSTTNWWHWSSAFFGPLIGLGVTHFSSALGVGSFVVFLCSGLLLSGMVSDALGIFGPKKAPTPLAIAGSVVCVLGVYLCSKVVKEIKSEPSPTTASRCDRLLYFFFPPTFRFSPTRAGVSLLGAGVDAEKGTLVLTSHKLTAAIERNN